MKIGIQTPLVALRFPTGLEKYKDMNMTVAFITHILFIYDRAKVSMHYVTFFLSFVASGLNLSDFLWNTLIKR